MRGLIPFVTALTVVGTPVSAQMTGTRMGGPPAGASSTRSPEALRRLLVDYAGCVINENRIAVEKYLATPPSSPASDRLWTTIAIERCLAAGELTLTDAGFRAGAFEKLYRLDFGENGPLDLSARAEIDYALGYGEPTPAVLYAVSLRGVVDCVVRHAPGAARSLVHSRIGSSAEDKAYAGLTPAFGPCLDRGAKVTFSKGALRGIVAETLYRLSKAPLAPASAVETKP
jgi:hypothetical protein